MNKPANKKVLVAMSGGVDSSVAAALLLEQGYDVVGCFMRLGNEEPAAQACATGATGAGASLSLPLATGSQGSKPKANKQGCCSVEDASDARLVSAMLDIPFYVMNFRKDFGRIIDYFVAEYNAGRTPNPCVRCNDWLKFGKLWDYAQSIDADYVATGHYARVEHGSPDMPGNEPRLLCGADQSKDQSYVLFGTDRDHLRHMLLPIGQYQKSEIRQMAKERDLPVFNKPDSQEICFVPDNDYGGLIERNTPDQVCEGDILDQSGKVVGRHPGQQHFTIGQRRGIGVAVGVPIYVTDKDPQANTITIGGKDQLLSEHLIAGQTNWLIDPPEIGSPLRCEIKIRYNSSAEPGTVWRTAEDQLEARFDQPQSAVTPGQAVVCYEGQRVIAGGWIDHAAVIARSAETGTSAASV
jgi:tRNA-specific 2-thiouridylase